MTELFHEGMREHTPKMCWRFLNKGKSVCILERGHDDGEHEVEEQEATQPALARIERLAETAQFHICAGNTDLNRDSTVAALQVVTDARAAVEELRAVLKALGEAEKALSAVPRQMRKPAFITTLTGVRAALHTARVER